MYFKTFHPELPKPELLPEYVRAAQDRQAGAANSFTAWLKKMLSPAQTNKH